MNSKRHLTRYTYETTAFLGWRVSISRSGNSFTRYFSDKKYGDAEKSLAAAERALAGLVKLLDGAKKKRGKLRPLTVERAIKKLASAS